MANLSPTVQTWLNTIPNERVASATELIKTIEKNIPKGFELMVQGTMLAWVVPLSTFPAGYHCSPGTPLPFLNLASQKNALTLYHMGIYAKPDLLEWFETSWPQHTPQKLDMGKSCLRLKKLNEIPFALIGELMKKMSPAEWITTYQQAFQK